MKHLNHSIMTLATALLLSVAGLLTAQAQGILVHKQSGSTIDVPASELRLFKPTDNRMEVLRTAGTLVVPADSLDYIETYEAMKQEGEGFTGEFSQQMAEDIPEELLRQMNEHGMPIYSGSNPPSVEGVFDFNPTVLTWSSDDCYKPGQEFAACLYQFSNQNMSQGLVDYKSKEYTARYGISLSESEAQACRIVGSGNHFTAWYIQNGRTGYITTKEATIISGTLTDEGIRDMYYTFTMLEKQNDDFHKLVEPGTIRTFKDLDGLAQKDEWWVLGGDQHIDLNWQTIDFGGSRPAKRIVRVQRRR